jgi:CBS domain-containing protein
VICPVCQWRNYEGDDLCENCGADLRATDIPQPATSFQGKLLGAHLDELGAPEPETTESGTSVGDAIARMRRDGLDCLLVTDHGRLVGIFTDRDAVLKVAGQAADRRPVSDLMTPDPVVLRHDDPIAVAINKMAVGGFRHVPIVEDGRPTGLVSARDVFRHISTRLG